MSKKWEYSTTTRPVHDSMLGTMSEDDHIREEASDGWELLGPPVSDGEDWVYYWKKEKEQWIND